MKKKALQPITNSEVIGLGFQPETTRNAVSISLPGFTDDDSGTKKLMISLSDAGVATCWIEIRQGAIVMEIDLNGINTLKDIETQLRLIFGKGGAA